MNSSSTSTASDGKAGEKENLGDETPIAEGASDATGQMEILSCPFCDGTARVFQTGISDPKVSIRCDTCKAQSSPFHYRRTSYDTGLIRAQALWNRRAGGEDYTIRKIMECDGEPRHKAAERYRTIGVICLALMALATTIAAWVCAWQAGVAALCIWLVLFACLAFDLAVEADAKAPSESKVTKSDDVAGVSAEGESSVLARNDNQPASQGEQQKDLGEQET